MAWWNRVTQGIKKALSVIGLGGQETPREQRRREAKQRGAPFRPPPQREPVSRETEEYRERLRELRSEQAITRELESIFLNDSYSEDDRKAALRDYEEHTGAWRPARNDAWSSEEWRRWEEVYESEPELW